MTVFEQGHEGTGKFPYTVEEFAVALNFIISLEPDDEKLTGKPQKVE